ncbi:hypothetical protein M404DRAFT_159150, partial [Pisolithus tinctorius Marx 270]
MELAAPVGEVDEGAKCADWMVEETTALIKYLHVHCSEHADAGNFCQVTYVNAAEHIRPLHQTGKIKDYKNVSIKWGSIKQIYNAIMTYCRGSGEHWDNENSANICGAADAEKWGKFVAIKRNTIMRPFRNKGWEYLHFMEDIFPQG